MLLPKSIASCVCIPTFRSLTQKVCLTKIPFVAIFWPDRDTKVGVVIYMYSKYSPDYIDSKYIWVHGSNSLGSGVLTEISFLTFLAYYRERKTCGQVGPNTCYSQNEVIYIYQVNICSSKGFSGKNTNLGFFGYHDNYFPNFLAHFLI